MTITEATDMFPDVTGFRKVCAVDPTGLAVVTYIEDPTPPVIGYIDGDGNFIKGRFDVSVPKTYAYHKPSPDATQVIEAVRQAFGNLHQTIESLCPSSRERSVALTHLETTAMWAIKSIVCNDPGSVVVEPTKTPEPRSPGEPSV